MLNINSSLITDTLVFKCKNCDNKQRILAQDKDTFTRCVKCGSLINNPPTKHIEVSGGIPTQFKF